LDGEVLELSTEPMTWKERTISHCLRWTRAA